MIQTYLPSVRNIIVKTWASGWTKFAILAAIALGIFSTLESNGYKIESISEVVWLAIIAVSSPLLLAFLTGLQREHEKQEDWERQDEVARKLKEDNAKVAATVAKSTDAMQDQLHIIHTLVNSSLTAAMKQTLESTIRELALMQEVVDLKVSINGKPLPVAERAIELTEQKIGELQAGLDDRAKAAARIAYGEGIPVVGKDQVQKT